ncbi:MAG TPA: siroheme synthase CysG [Anaeromyxobacteraceae bacterium]|nr:siroheme synthase CysG [Anaeromyxobacteraceae bacterium]
MYPVMLSLRGRPVLVVGGGEVALRKIEGLLAEGARVTAIAPEAAAGVEDLARRGEIVLHRRSHRSGDAGGFALVFAATDDRETNDRVFAEAQAAGIWVNVADEPERCTFHLPARVRRGALQLAIASDGGAPFVVRRLRQVLERRLGQEWSEWMEAATRFRQAVRALALPRAAAERRFDAFFTASVDVERLRARVPASTEVAAWLAPRRGEAAAGGAPPGGAAAGGEVVALRPRTRSAAGPPPALVSLVGAGPGDPGLLTVRARQRLLAADAVVYDRLAAGALPPDLRAEVELHCVGKEAGNHPVPQEEIAALLVRLALAGKRTVRLKGGDPLVFGRGGEEADVLRRAGVPYEFVPGVTAALGATACAGIPVTHRGESVRLTLVTAHESAKGDGPQVRWDLLAQDPHATLVGYMGVSRLPDVAAALVGAGMPASTPAALVAQGTTAAQRTVVSTLGALHAAAIAAGIRPPAVFVIGPTVRHAAALDWFASRPLSGERLAVFGPPDALGAALDLAGAEVVQVPRPLTPAARVVLAAAPLTGWILRGAREVDAVEEEGGVGGAAEQRAFCLDGPAAERARALGWDPVVALDAASRPEAVVEAVAGCVRGASIGRAGKA